MLRLEGNHLAETQDFDNMDECEQVYNVCWPICHVRAVFQILIYVSAEKSDPVLGAEHKGGKQNMNTVADKAT